MAESTTAAQPQITNPPNVDDLAREKVEEIEKLLASSQNFEPDILDSSLSILKQIITAADLHRTNDKNDNSKDVHSKTETGDSIYADYADDNEQFNTIDLTEQLASNSVKWTIRVRAFKAVHKIVQSCSAPIKSIKLSILKHLPDLVRLAFVAATSPYDDLKMQGFEMFKFIINRFATVEEKEFPGHSILEQYKTQILSALKPAFNLDAPPYITAIASQVCSLWMCRGLEHSDAHNLKRTYQFMLASIEKLENQSLNQNSKLYTETELEQERLSILGAWAQLYIAAKDTEESQGSVHFNHQLISLVKPNIGSVIDKWWEALKDYALLIMPTPKFSNSPHGNDDVYTREVALNLFDPIWPKLILASSFWLCHERFRNGDSDNSESEQKLETERQPNCDHNLDQTKYFRFICGILLRELCRYSSHSEQNLEHAQESTVFALRSLSLILNNEKLKIILTQDLSIAQEFYAVLYKILIRRPSIRDSLQKSLKTLMDQIFELVLRKVSPRDGLMHQAAEHIVVLIEDDLKLIETKAGDLKCQDYAKSMLHLSIEISSLYALVRLDPYPDSLHDIIIGIFKRMITFEADMSIGIGLVKGINSNLTVERASMINRCLFETSVSSISKLIGAIAAEKGSSARSLSYLEIYTKFARNSLDMVADIAGPLSCLVGALLEAHVVVHEIMKDVESNQNSRQLDLLDFQLKHIEELKVAFPDEFEKLLSGELGNNYRKLRDIQQKIKVVSEKHVIKVLKANTATVDAKNHKPKAKITLKADFSNFYAKKN